MRKRVSLSEFRHQWVEDILYYEGPLLSLLKANTAQDFFYYWCGTLDNDNQWLAFQVTRNQIEDYKNQAISLLEIVKSNQCAYVVFIDAQQSLRRVWQYSIDALPAGVMPPKDSLFDPALCVAEDGFLEKPGTYAIKVDGDNWFIDDMIGVPRVFQQMYAFVYTLCHSRKQSVRSNAAEIFRKYPWRGGYSRYNFFHDLRRAIPSMHEAKIDSLQMASEGAFKFSLEVGAAEYLSSAVEITSGNLGALRELKKQADTILKDNHLNRFKSNVTSLQLAPEVASALKHKVDGMAAGMGLLERLDDIRQMAGNDLVAIKILIAFFLRVERFAEFQASGKAELQ